MSAKFNKKPIKMWAVWGDCGLYVDTAYTKKDMIERHVSALGYTWDHHYKKGDRLVRITVLPERLINKCS